MTEMSRRSLKIQLWKWLFSLHVEHWGKRIVLRYYKCVGTENNEPLFNLTAFCGCENASPSRSSKEGNLVFQDTSIRFTTTAQSEICPRNSMLACGESFSFPAPGSNSSHRLCRRSTPVSGGISMKTDNFPVTQEEIARGSRNFLICHKNGILWDANMTFKAGGKVLLWKSSWSCFGNK